MSAPSLAFAAPMSDFGLATGMFAGFAVFAAGLAFFFLRAVRGRRTAWITALCVLAFFALLGWALAVFVLPELRTL